MSFNVTEIIACANDEKYINFVIGMACIIFLPCVVGNSLILISICKFKFLRTKAHILIGNLAVADLLVGACFLDVPLAMAFPGDSLASKYLCLARYGFFVTSVTSSMANLLVMSFERFLSVAFPIKHRVYFSRRKLYVCISAIWIIHITFGLLPTLGWNNYSPENEIVDKNCITHLIWPHKYYILLVSDLTLGLIVNTIIYAIVICIAIRVKQIRSAAVGSSGIKNKTKMIMIVFGAFAVCWMPFVLVSIIVLVNDTAYYRCIQEWLVFVGFINSALNWAIYGFTNIKFRKGFCMLLKSSVCRRTLPTQMVTSVELSNMNTPKTERKVQIQDQVGGNGSPD